MGIKAGSVVQLNSGGPLLTVEEVKENTADCIWFTGDELRGAVFKLASLEVKEKK